MLNLNVLRAHVPTITVAEYLSLHDLPTNLENTNGKWNPIKYHNTSFPVQKPTLATIRNRDFDLDIIRVDHLPPTHSTNLTTLKVDSKILSSFNSRKDRFQTISLQESRNILLQDALITWEDGDTKDMETVLKNHGLGALYTFVGR